MADWAFEQPNYKNLDLRLIFLCACASVWVDINDTQANTNLLRLTKRIIISS